MTSTTAAAKCIVPARLTTRRDYDNTYVLEDGAVIVHRYANQQAADRAAALHAHPEACHTCLHGCDCDMTIPSDGCGHFGCWGPVASLFEPCEFAAVIRGKFENPAN